MNDVASTTDKPAPPPKTTRYDSLNVSVLTLNEQIEELVAANEHLEGDIEVYEKQIREAKRMMARNDREANKLRRKRDVVRKAAFEYANEDQP